MTQTNSHNCEVKSHLIDSSSRDALTYPIVHVSLVVPVYNESATVKLFLDHVRDILVAESIRLEVVFVNDGSEDETLARLLGYKTDDLQIRIVDLTRNFGKEAALTAGLKASTGRVVVPMDVDLQDPPELIIEMISRWREGYDVVLGRRIDRSSDSWAKRVSAKCFYWVHNKISELSIPENVGDFRLMDRVVVDALCELTESRRFMKGLFAWVGYRTTFVDYIRSERVAGISKFNAWKLWNLAFEGLTSFSIVPLRVWTYFGGLVALLSFIYGIVIVVRVLLFGIDTPGYASLMVVTTFLGGLQLIGLGLIGEYLGRTYFESKRRPVYLVRSIYNIKD